jgi:DNA polymerase V
MAVMTEQSKPINGKEAKAFPLLGCSLSAGFPSPADDHLEDTLEPNDYLIENADNTFFFRIRGDSMTGAGIHENDVLVVDCKVTPRHGKIVVADIGGEYTVKRLYMKDGKTMLVPENDAYAPIEPTDGNELKIFGVATGVMRRF